MGKVQTKTKIRRGADKLTSADRWDMLKDYIDNKITNSAIAEKYNVSYKVLEDFIRDTYQSFQNTREAKLLVATASRPDVFQTMKAKYIDSESINKPFLEKLSEPHDPLTDSEVLYCEFLFEYGDDAKAIEKSKLNVGLKKTHLPTYTEGLKLRSFFLKKKPNVMLYLSEQKRRNLDILPNGKEFIQSKLITMIDQLDHNNNDPRSLPSQLKAIEYLGRTIGAFDDKLTIESTNGDDALDAILKRAKKIKEDLIELEPTHEA